MKFICTWKSDKKEKMLKEAYDMSKTIYCDVQMFIYTYVAL